jgi:hypothetical protein
MTTKSIDEQIKIILNQMDFKKIHGVMDFLGWTWKCDAEGKRTPTVQELKHFAVHCMKRAWLSEDKFYNSGGFECEIIDNTIELKFIIERVNPLSNLLG